VAHRFRVKKPMSADQIFVDTNILVYAHDIDAGAKYRIARDKVSALWHRDLLPSISVQVLQEFYVNLIRKKIPAPVARETVTNYLEWDVIDNDRFLFIEGIRWKEKWHLSYWDALKLAAAWKSGAKEVWSEDLDSGQEYDGIVVINPLIPQIVRP
jgi:predicted nucleic acid-binding protein